MDVDIRSLISEFRDKIDNEKFRKLISDGLESANSDSIKLANLALAIIKNSDFFEIGSISEDEKNRFLNKLSSIVVKILNPQNNNLAHLTIDLCGLHEETACVMFKEKPTLRNAVERIDKEWPTLPLWANLCFESEPDPRSFSKIKVFRILGPYNKTKGNWWFIDFYPDSRPYWRHRLAVLTDWNEGTQFVEFTPTEELKVWSGRAVWQPVPKELCFLPGMGHQVWIDTAHLPTGELLRKNIDWNNPPFHS